MKIKLIIGFLLSIILVIFTIQNAEVVNVKFLFWEVEISRALLILISMGTGALAYSLLSLSSTFRSKNNGKTQTSD